ncbi:hypothetical protein NPIL_548681, partial [Nephila pilipes]
FKPAKRRLKIKPYRPDNYPNIVKSTEIITSIEQLFIAKSKEAENESEEKKPRKKRKKSNPRNKSLKIKQSDGRGNYPKYDTSEEIITSVERLFISSPMKAKKELKKNKSKKKRHETSIKRLFIEEPIKTIKERKLPEHKNSRINVENSKPRKKCLKNKPYISNGPGNNRNLYTSEEIILSMEQIFIEEPKNANKECRFPEVKKLRKKRKKSNPRKKPLKIEPFNGRGNYPKYDTSEEIIWSREHMLMGNSNLCCEVKRSRKKCKKPKLGKKC